MDDTPWRRLIMPSWKSTTMVPWLAVLAGVGLGLGWLALRPFVATTLDPQPSRGTHPLADFQPLLLRVGPDDNPSGGSLTAVGIRADLSFRPKPDGGGSEQQQPVLRLWPAPAADETPISLLTDTPLLEHIGLSSHTTRALMQIVELDASNSSPEVLLSQYTGGAHCCALVTIFRETHQGRWQTIDAGDFDGDIFAATEPIPGHGYLLATVDNRFLYRFSGYALSSPPPQFLALQGEQMVDVGDQPHLRPLFEEDAQHKARRLANVLANPRDWEGRSAAGGINGLLAGYAASHARAGRIGEAWPVVLRRYDRQSQWGLKACPSGYNDQGNCRQGTVRYANFPSALAALLREAGYIAEDLVLANQP